MANENRSANMSKNDAILKAPQINVRELSSDLGRGVFSNRAFVKEEMVEVVPVILLSEDYSNLPLEFEDRVFDWGHLAGTSRRSCVALGYGSLYNHSDDPNLRYEACDEGKVMRFIARRAIDPVEQLTIHYDQAHGVHSEVENDWFGIHRVKQASLE